MATVRWICLDADDLMHENTGEENYNESAYYNFYDPAQRLGGFVRIGNRPNEGYAETTLCLYLPDGSVGFMFGRPKIANNARFDAGGMRFEVRTPMREHVIHYDGTACLLDRPLELLDPRAAFTQNPHVPAQVELEYRGLSPAHGGELREERDGRWVSVRAERSGQEFARGHLEQHGHATGRVTVGDRSWTVDGYGLRDRSWGPRYWQAPRYYRWLTMNFGDDAGIAAALTVQRDGSQVQGGYIYGAGRPSRPIARVEVSSDHAGTEQLHWGLRARLHPADGGSPEEVTGRVLSMVPLRNRRNGVTTRIAEGLTEWHWRGRVGYGWSEFLDHVDDLAERLAASVRVHLGADVTVDGLKRLPGGASREIWLFTASHPSGRREPLVLRRDPPGHVIESSRAGEFLLLETAAAAGVPVPRVRWCADESEGLGSAFVMDFVAGETIARRLLRDAEYAKARDVLPEQLAAALVRIHAMDASALGELTRPEAGTTPAAAELARFEGIHRAIAPDPHPAFELALRWLATRLPPSQRQTVVHGDYRVGNVIVGPEGLRAVIDWELTHVGDPMEDVGWLCVRSWRFGAPLPVGGLCERARFFAAYERAGGAPVDPAVVCWWEVFGNLRWGIMTLMQAQTFLGGVRNVELASLGRRTCEMELELLDLMDRGA